VSDIPPPPGAGQQPPPPPPPSAGAAPPPPPPPGLQAPAGYAAYHSGPTVATKRIGGLAKAIVILTAIAAVVTVITTFVSLAVAGDAQDYLAGDLTDDEFRSAIAPLNATQSLSGLATLATGVLTIIWMFRIASNIRAYGRRTTWHPLFSIFGWLLPPMFLYIIPFLVLREQWKGSDPDGLDGTDTWKSNADNRVLWGWFALYGIFPAILFTVQIGTLLDAGLAGGDLDSLADSIDSSGLLTVVSGALVVGAAAAWIVFVRQLTARHTTMTNEA
jgi:hypothetical protein